MGESTRVRRVTLTLVVLNGTATISGALLNGVVRGIASVAPATLTSANYTLSLLGPVAGMTLFSKGSLLANVTSNIPADGSANNIPAGGIAVDAASTLVITTASNEGANRTFTVTVLIER